MKFDDEIQFDEQEEYQDSLDVEEPQIIEIENINANGINTFVGCSFRGNELCVFTNVRSPQVGELPSFGQPSSKIIFPRVDAKTEEDYKLYNESHSVFMNLQKLKNLKESSKYYRALLKKYRLNINNESKQSLIRFQEEILHLCEILFIDAKTKQISPLLVDWFQTYHVPPSIKFINKENLDYEDEKFWEVVYALTLQGKTREVRMLIQNFLNQKDVDDDEDSVYKLLAVVLDHMPKLHERGEMKDFMSLFHSWQKDVKDLFELFEDDLQRNARELVPILQILTGDEETLKTQSSSWIELMISYILYKYPDTLKGNLLDLAIKCIEEKTDFDHLQDHESVIYAFLDEETIIEGVKMCKLFGDWFACHLCDLLYHCNRISSEMREEFILDYVNDIFMDTQLWKIILDYCQFCERKGIYFIHEILTRIPIESEKLLQKLSHYGNDEMNKLLHSVFATKQINEGNYSNAVRHLILAKDSSRISKIANLILGEYLKDTENTHQLKAISECVANIPFVEKNFSFNKLAFISKYTELLEELQKKDYKKAGEIIISLLNNNTLSPRRFWIILLMHAVALLENTKEIIFNVQQTQLLMNSLEELVVSHRSDEYLREISNETIQVIRLALTRNLSRAIICQ